MFQCTWKLKSVNSNRASGEVANRIDHYISGTDKPCTVSIRSDQTLVLTVTLLYTYFIASDASATHCTNLARNIGIHCRLSSSP